MANEEFIYEVSFILRRKLWEGINESKAKIKEISVQFLFVSVFSGVDVAINLTRRSVLCCYHNITNVVIEINYKKVVVYTTEGFFPFLDEKKIAFYLALRIQTLRK